MYKIRNKHANFYKENKELVEQFLDFSANNLGFNKPVTVDFVEDEQAGYQPLGRTAHYNPNSMKVVVYTCNRHPKDILRSLSHELVHHCQNCNGEIPESSVTHEGYAQTDKKMRSLEEEAYLKGNIMNFRDFEDQYKMKNKKENINEVSGVYRELAMSKPELAADYLVSQNRSWYVTEAEGMIVQNSVIKWAKAAKKDPRIAVRFMKKYNQLGGKTEKKGELDVPVFRANFSPFSDVDNSLTGLIKSNLHALASAAARVTNKKDGAAGDQGGGRIAGGGKDVEGGKGGGGDVPASGGKGGEGSKDGKGRIKGQKIKRLQDALIAFGQRLPKYGADGSYGRETQNAINDVRRKYSLAPKRQRDFWRSVELMTRWLEKNKDLGRNAKATGTKSSKDNSSLQKVKNIVGASNLSDKSYDELMALKQTIDRMRPSPKRREAYAALNKAIKDFRSRQAEERGLKESKKIPRTISKKNELVTKLLTEKLLGNAKNKNK